MTAEVENKDQTLSKNPDSTDDEDITFNFFYDIVKQLILKRNDIGDACVLSSWLKVLEQNKNKTVRNDYIKLMMLALQHTEPICPFKDPPPEKIDPLENGVIEMARRFLKKEGTATCIGDNELDFEDTYPTINTALSNDKHQYASYQVIPNVGVQCYYASSDEPMNNWSLPTPITVPVRGPHATDVEWERALAGITFKLHKPITDNLQFPNTKKNAISKDDEVKSSLANGSRYSRKKSDRLKESGETPDFCNLTDVEQQNRNVTEVFEWNDASLLTGDIRLGAEMCSDRKVDVQFSTQIELDKEVFNAYDKLYPGDFTIDVEQSVIDAIIPMKTNVVAEASCDKSCDNKRIEDEEKEKQQQQQQQQPSVHDGGGCGGPRKKPLECPRPTLCTIRQSAGQGNVKPLAEERRTVVEKSPLDHHRQRISELTLKLDALNAVDSRTDNDKSCDTIADPPARRLTPANNDLCVTSPRRRGRGGDDVDGDGDDDCRRGGSASATQAQSTESHAERQLDSGLLLKRSELRSMLDFTGECFEEVSSMLRTPLKDPKSISLAQLYGRTVNSRDGESDA